MQTAPDLSRLSLLPAPQIGRTGWPWTVETLPPPDAGQIAWPRITLVTPSFGQALYLEECLRSVLLQNYPALDFRVMDGGSKDGSVEILERYAPHLSHWQSRKDGGQGEAINQGFSGADGEIYGWINSDDFLLPGALFSVARAFLQSPCDLVYGDALNLHEEDGTVEYWQGHWVTAPFLQFGGLLASHATYWRQSIHQPLWAELQCNIDGELWQRLVPGRRLQYLPVPLGVYRAHQETKSFGAGWKSKWDEDDALIWARHGRTNRQRLFTRGFLLTQRVFKWMAWRRDRQRKRAVINACEWQGIPWRGPTP